jgi:hypothetical protein
LVRLKCIFICHIAKPKEGIAHKNTLKGKYLLFDYTTICKRINRLDNKMYDNKSDNFEDDT